MTTYGQDEPRLPHETIGPPPEIGHRAVQWHRIWLGVAGFLFALLCVTGVLLMTVYTPSTTGAWGSVWYIQTQLSCGWLIRGLHRFSSDALMIVLPIYLFHLLLTKAYRPPHHVRWWLGWLSLAVAMAAALSGHLLPWDQRGYWGMKVRLNILATTPIVGDWLRELLIGGSEMGSLTLTRFYTLHVAVLPLALAPMLRCLRAKRSLPKPASTEHGPNTSTDSPVQRLIHALTNMIVLVILARSTWLAVPLWISPMLDAPADPAASDYPARPEWFNLFLFQWLKYFHGPTMEVIGAVFIPGALMGVLLALPYLHRAVGRNGRRGNLFAHVFAITYCLLLGFGVVWLTYAAIRDDKKPTYPVDRAIQAKRISGEALTPDEEKMLNVLEFHRHRWLWQLKATRTAQLAAQSGIPPEGPLALLENDFATRGRELFVDHCAVCHRWYHMGPDGLGIESAEPATSSNLGGFATRRWIRGLLTNPMDDRYFGLMKKPDGTPAHTRMAKFLKELRDGQPDAAAREELEANLDAVAAYFADESLYPGRLASAPIDPANGAAHSADHFQSEISNLKSEISNQPKSRASTAADSANTLTPAATSTAHASKVDLHASDEIIKRGREFFMTVCNECHSYRGQRFGTFGAPEMYGYGSVEWLELMIAEPNHETRYRSTGREPAQMPPFRDRLTPDEIKLIAQWIHGGQIPDP